MDDLQHQFEACVGDSLDDAWFLAKRYLMTMGDSRPIEDFRRREHWIGRVRGGAIVRLWGTRTFLKGLVVSPQREVYTIAERYGDLWPYEPNGVWRFDDDGIDRFWPSRASAKSLLALADGSVIVPSGGDWPLLRFDGATFAEMPHPNCDVQLLHGRDDRLLLAGAWGGEVAVWEGQAWSPPERLGGYDLSAVLATSSDRMYAATFLPSRVFRRDGQRWVEVAEVVSAFTSLAEYRGHVYVGIFEQGIARVDDGGLAVAPLPVMPVALHAGATALIITDESQISDTTDLRELRRIGIEDLVAALAGRAPLWETGAVDSDRKRFRQPLYNPQYQDPTEYVFSACVGRSFDDAFCLVQRGEVKERLWGDAERESIVGRIRNGRVEDVTPLRARVESISLSRSGRLYAAVDQDGAGLWRTDPEGRLEWEKLDVPAMEGVFALDDGCVICWGRAQGEQYLFQFDGRTCARMPAPPGVVEEMHGCAPDWIVAGGNKSLLARWDGRTWHPWSLPSPPVGVGPIVVVSPEEMYAAGPTSLFQGKRNSWALRATFPYSATGLARFKQDILVSDLSNGLLRLDGNALLPIPLRAFPQDLHGGADALIMREREGFAETRDFTTIRRIGPREMDFGLRHDAPSWRSPP